MEPGAGRVADEGEEEPVQKDGKRDEARGRRAAVAELLSRQAERDQIGRSRSVVAAEERFAEALSAELRVHVQRRGAQAVVLERDRRDLLCDEGAKRRDVLLLFGTGRESEHEVGILWPCRGRRAASGVRPSRRRRDRGKVATMEEHRAPGRPSLQVGPVQPEEERKLVTIVFADLSGSTALAERLDAEELRSVLTSFFNALANALQRYGGTIDKYAGAAVMAGFGAPLGPQDGSPRAIRAPPDMHGSSA